MPPHPIARPANRRPASSSSESTEGQETSSEGFRLLVRSALVVLALLEGSRISLGSHRRWRPEQLDGVVPGRVAECDRVDGAGLREASLRGRLAGR